MYVQTLFTPTAATRNQAHQHRWLDRCVHSYEVQSGKPATLSPPWTLCHHYSLISNTPWKFRKSPSGIKHTTLDHHPTIAASSRQCFCRNPTTAASCSSLGLAVVVAGLGHILIAVTNDLQSTPFSGSGGPLALIMSQLALLTLCCTAQ
jgi:hypothetical protein